MSVKLLTLRSSHKWHVHVFCIKTSKRGFLRHKESFTFIEIAFFEKTEELLWETVNYFPSVTTDCSASGFADCWTKERMGWRETARGSSCWQALFHGLLLVISWFVQQLATLKFQSAVNCSSDSHRLFLFIFLWSLDSVELELSNPVCYFYSCRDVRSRRFHHATNDFLWIQWEFSASKLVFFFLNSDSTGNKLSYFICLWIHFERRYLT